MIFRCGLSDCCYPFSVVSRRVHISSVTLEHLNGSYKVEAGNGQSRDSYLKEHGVVTYLVINPKVPYMAPKRLNAFAFVPRHTCVQRVQSYIIFIQNCTKGHILLPKSELLK